MSKTLTLYAADVLVMAADMWGKLVIRSFSLKISQLSSWQTYGLAFLIGCLTSLSQPPFDLGWICFFTFPFLVWLLDGTVVVDISQKTIRKTTIKTAIMGHSARCAWIAGHIGFFLCFCDYLCSFVLEQRAWPYFSFGSRLWLGRMGTQLFVDRVPLEYDRLRRHAGSVTNAIRQSVWNDRH